MKQDLVIGNVVDDGTGDYLRAGGQKINNNFDELYSQLGDGSIPFAAGAWQTWTANLGTKLTPVLGSAWIVDTQYGSVSVTLPKGTVNDYGKAIKLRDVWNSWRLDPLTVIPAAGDTMKGSSSSVIFNTNGQDLELVYCSPGRWEYIQNKQVDGISNSNSSAVAKAEIIATQGQTDFLDIFSGEGYNILAVNVYRRGNILYYGSEFSDSSDYGSPGTDATTIIALDGTNIRLRNASNEGDVITVETFVDGVGSRQSSYNKINLQMLDSSLHSGTTVAGDYVITDLTSKFDITLDDLGVLAGTNINPSALEVYKNGVLLAMAGTGILPAFKCSGANGVTEAECEGNKGNWVANNVDYAIQYESNTSTVVTALLFDEGFNDGDIISVTWFNNNIGTTLSIDDITDETDTRYINAQSYLNLTNRIEYTDYNAPSQATKRAVADSYNFQISTVQAMFDIFHPVGSIYENAHNSANPSNYMGMGTWVAYGQGKVIAGWNSDSSDPNFHLNTSDLDSSGNPTATSGGSVGSTTVTLKTNNVPILSTTDKVLVADDNGTIIVGGCLIDPDAQGPGYTKYTEKTTSVNVDTVSPIAISTIQPSLTAYRWLRVA